jgi:hypothetical protein
LVEIIIAQASNMESRPKVGTTGRQIQETKAIKKISGDPMGDIGRSGEQYCLEGEFDEQVIPTAWKDLYMRRRYV